MESKTNMARACITMTTLLQLILFISLTSPFVSGCGPTKVFLLDGQSNMVGMGSIAHLQKLLNDSKTHDEYAHLWNSTGQTWSQRNDVYCKFDDHVGKLTVGFGAPARGGHFGTELEFGWVLGDAFGECQKPILLLKTAYGGRDLAVDFRPPSSGKGNYNGVKPIHYGWEYRTMIEDILATLDNLTNIVPGYNVDDGYELAGFVWFQGWNDMLSYQKVNEYEFNLANLIRDVRADLDAPNLPFLIGELGMKGTDATGRGSDRYYSMQRAEHDVTLYDEFRNNTLFVPTAQFMKYPGNDTYNGIYHYNGRADVYTHIGRAFGRGMLQLLGATPLLFPGNLAMLRGPAVSAG